MHEGWRKGALIRRGPMPIYGSRGKFSTDAVKGMLAKPVSLTDIATTAAMTAKEAAETFGAAGKAARSFRSAGRT
jgi:hypothetical protein